MPKILVFNVPAHGHVNPTLPVVRELVDRGEQVVYYLTDEFEPKIERTGAVFRRLDIPDRWDPPTNMNRGGRPNLANAPQIMATFFPRMMARSLRMVPELIERARAEEADYVIYDPMCLWGRVLAELLGLPAVTFRPSYALNEHSPLAQRISSIFQEQLPPPAVEAINDFQNVSRQLQERYGLAPLHITDLFTHGEALNVVALPRQFQPDGDTFDERYVFVGPSISPRGDVSGFPIDQLTRRPTLYISLGTVFNANPEFFAACFDAFANSRWQVVLSVGTRVAPSDIGRAPDNFLVRPHVPQLEVLEHTDVFVTHGGMNSVMEAVYYGVPMVVVPQQPEQAMTTARVTELGLGIGLDPDRVTAEELRNAVATIDGDPGYRSHIAHMQKAAREAGGYLRAADVIQQFFRRPEPEKAVESTNPNGNIGGETRRQHR